MSQVAEGVQFVNGAHDAGASPAVDFFCADSLLTDEERAVRDRVRAFAAERLRPVAREAWETATFPRQLLPELAALDVVGGTISGHGCPGLSSVAFGVVLRELSRVDSSFATFVNVQSGLSMSAIAACGTEEQQARWLPRLARCEALGAFALTEPEHGSDV